MTITDQAEPATTTEEVPAPSSVDRQPGGQAEGPHNPDCAREEPCDQGRGWAASSACRHAPGHGTGQGMWSGECCDCSCHQAALSGPPAPPERLQATAREVAARHDATAANLRLRASQDDCARLRARVAELEAQQGRVQELEAQLAAAEERAGHISDPTPCERCGNSIGALGEPAAGTVFGSGPACLPCLLWSLGTHVARKAPPPAAKPEGEKCACVWRSSDGSRGSRQGDPCPLHADLMAMRAEDRGRPLSPSDRAFIASDPELVEAVLRDTANDPENVAPQPPAPATGEEDDDDVGGVLGHLDEADEAMLGLTCDGENNDTACSCGWCVHRDAVREISQRILGKEYPQRRCEDHGRMDFVIGRGHVCLGRVQELEAELARADPRQRILEQCAEILGGIRPAGIEPPEEEGDLPRWLTEAVERLHRGRELAERLDTISLELVGEPHPDPVNVIFRALPDGYRATPVRQDCIRSRLLRIGRDLHQLRKLRDDKESEVTGAAPPPPATPSDPPHAAAPAAGAGLSHGEILAIAREAAMLKGDEAKCEARLHELEGAVTELAELLHHRRELEDLRDKEALLADQVEASDHRERHLLERHREIPF